MDLNLKAYSELLQVAKIDFQLSRDHAIKNTVVKGIGFHLMVLEVHPLAQIAFIILQLIKFTQLDSTLLPSCLHLIQRAIIIIIHKVSYSLFSNTSILIQLQIIVDRYK